MPFFFIVLFEMCNCFQKIIDKYGCTVPFLQPKVNEHLNICTDQTTGQKAYSMYIELSTKFTTYTSVECPYPCTYLKTKMVNSKTSHDNWTSGFGFVFNLFTKRTTAHYTYTELELIAEFGGYVGLFLGYSVLSLTGVFDRILDYSMRN